MAIILNGNPISGNTVTSGIDIPNSSAVDVTVNDAGTHTINFATSTSDANLNGGTGADTITAGSGDDIIYGGGGSDSIVGGSGNDQLIIGSLNSTVNSTTSSNSTVVGGTGSATIDVLMAGTDSITGGATGSNNDYFFIGSSVANYNPTITASIKDLHGTDVLDVLNSNSTVNATVTSAWTATSDSINNGTANLTTSGLAVDLTNAGGTHSWKVTNTGAATTLTGTGSDTLIAGSNNDTININNGTSTDSISGGSGTDTFNVNSGIANIDLFNAKDILNVKAGATAFVTLTGDWTPTAAQLSNLGTVHIYSQGFKVDLSAVTGTGTFIISDFNPTNAPVGNGNSASGSHTANNTFSETFGTTNTIPNLGSGTNDIVQVSSGVSVTATVTAPWTATSASYNSGTATLNTAGLAVNLAAVGAAPSEGANNGWKVVNTGKTSTTLTSSNYADTLQAGAGNDILVGNGVNTELKAGTGVDTFKVLKGSSIISGLGTKADLLIVSADATATAKLAASWSPNKLTSNSGTVNIDVNGLSFGHSAATGSGIWNISNSSTKKAVVLTGSAGGTVTSVSQNDTLVAVSGNETLIGGSGKDKFIVNAGATGIVINHFINGDSFQINPKSSKLAPGSATIHFADSTNKTWLFTGTSNAGTASLDLTGLTSSGQVFDLSKLSAGTYVVADSSATGNTFLTDVATKQVFNLTQNGAGTDTVVGFSTGETLNTSSGHFVLDVAGKNLALTSASDGALTGLIAVNAQAAGTTINVSNQSEALTIGSVGITSLSGDFFTSSKVQDTFVINDVGTGITAAKQLTITVSSTVGAEIHYVTGVNHTAVALTVGTSTTVNGKAPLATFDSDGNTTFTGTGKNAPTTLAAEVAAIAKAFATEGTTTAKGLNSSVHNGEYALFSNNGHEYLYISHGNEGTASTKDTLIELMGISTTAHTVSLVDGNLTIGHVV